MAKSTRAKADLANTIRKHPPATPAFEEASLLACMDLSSETKEPGVAPCLRRQHSTNRTGREAAERKGGFCQSCRRFLGGA